MLRLVVIAAAVVVAASLAARLVDHERCGHAQTELFAMALREDADPAAQDEAVARIRDHCRGATALAGAARALLDAGRGAEALAVAREATRDEPDNARAWRAVRAAASGRDATVAEQRLRELDPLG